MNDHPRLPIAVLISGGGTTFRNLLEKISAGTLDVDVRLVISSSSTAGGLEIAQDQGIPTQVIRAQEFDTPEGFSQAVFDACRDADVQLVVMGGFLNVIEAAGAEARMLPIARDTEASLRAAFELAAGADLIVIGTHGRHGLGLLLGSTASGVIHGVQCDVLAVRVSSEAREISS